MYKVSIIIPVYNSEKYLKYTIESIIKQSFKDWELIIVDDCSTDKSYLIAYEYSLNYKNISVYKFKQNMGAWAARNYGIKKANGEWIILMDADDISHTERLKIHSRFWDDPNILICYSDSYIINENENDLIFKNINVCNFKYKILNRNEFIKHWFFKGVTGSTVSYRTKYALNVGLYKNLRIEDAYLLYELINKYKDLNIVYIKEPLYYYRIHSGQKTSLKVKTDIATIKLYFIYLIENKLNYNEKSIVLYLIFRRLLILIYHLLGLRGNPINYFSKNKLKKYKFIGKYNDK
ncbi:glycosyltransferase family 2 protein [Thermoanaerobacterium saccharolyticum]|uniref:glycosyltransferase family 2 protein n=1 Tax=Thermoanaerobacterium saccharolyticum TaxID=28896 RepID=UPI002FDB94C3